jgi:tripartite ATP-independent transporter DctP family solute receptor
MKFIKTLLAALVTASAIHGAPALAQSPVVMRMASVTPEQHPVSTVLKKVAGKINARPDLNLKMELFVAGTLGGDLEALDQVSRGAVQGTAAGGISVLQGYNPKFGIEELPFLFADREAAYKAMDGKLGEEVARLAEQHGFKVLAYWENGFRHFTNSKRPIVAPKDMSGLRFRSAESKIRLEMFKQLKASAMPMPFTELYQALQQGVVDGQENPVGLITSASLYTVQKHLSFSGHIWSAIPIVVSKKWYDGLNEKQRTALREEFYAARVEQRALIASQEAEQIKFLKSKGVQVTSVDVKAFRQATDPVWKTAEPIFGADWMAIARQARDGAAK